MKENMDSSTSQIIYELSQQIVKAQQPIRVLNAIKWPIEVQKQFFAKKCKSLPAVDLELYNRNPLNFDPNEKTSEFYAIEREIRRRLGQFSGVANIMLRMCREYREVIRLIISRGTPDFCNISQELYGSSQDAFYGGAPTLKDLAQSIAHTLALSQFEKKHRREKRYTSEEAVAILGKRLQKYFHDPTDQVHVTISGDIHADASAGADCIRLRADTTFTKRELRALEVHEGWVHVATTLNGMAQPVCTFLSKGPPSSTLSQEGLGVIMEIFTFSSYPERVKRLAHRITAINMAEQGADFLDVFRFYQSKGFSDEESYYAGVRVFRGCPVDRGPFSKDLSYTKGFVLIYNYIRLAIKNGLAHHIPLLFIGKTTLEDLPILYELMQQGIVTPPKYLPPQFADLAGLTAWMTYSLFLNQLDLEHLSVDYKGFLQE